MKLWLLLVSVALLSPLLAQEVDPAATRVFDSEWSDFKNLYRTGRYQSALTQGLMLQGRAELVFPEGDRRRFESTLGLGRLYRTMASFGLARPLLESALEQAEKYYGPESTEAARSADELSRVLLGEGYFAEALSSSERAIAAYRAAKGEDSVEVAWSQVSKADVLAELGDFPAAEPLYLEAERRLRERGGGLEVRALLGLAKLHARTGDRESARRFYQQVVETRKKVLGQEHPETANSIVELAGFEGSLSGSESAKEYLQAMTVLEAALGFEHPTVTKTMMQLGKIVLAQGDVEQAESNLDIAYLNGKRVLGEKHPTTLECQSALGELYRRTGRLEEAEEVLEQVLSARKELLGTTHPDTADVIRAQALVAYDQGDLERCGKLAREEKAAREAIVGQLLSFTSERRRLAYQASADPFSLLATLGDAEAIAESVLRQKGLVLDSLVEDLRLARESEGNPELATILTELKLARAEHVNSLMGIPENLSDSALEARRKRQNELQARVDSLESRLAAKVADLGRPRRALGVTLPEVRDALPAGTSLIEIVRYRHYLGGGVWTPRYGAVVLNKDKPEADWVSIGDADRVDRLMAEYRTLMNPLGESGWRDFHLDTGGVEADPEVFGLLVDEVWKRIASRLSLSTKDVVMSPDGSLSFLSFAALPVDELNFVANDFKVNYVATGRDLLQNVGMTTAPGMLVLGDPVFGSSKAEKKTARGEKNRSVRAGDVKDWSFRRIEWTGTECRDLEETATALGWDVKNRDVLLREQAKEEGLREREIPGLLHLATHGFFLPEVGFGASGGIGSESYPVVSLRNPMLRSGLALAGANETLRAWREGTSVIPGSDGILTALEVGALDLRRTWLVTLSACDTGTGEARAGEGVLGLRRGFVRAGARNLLMTLWPVADRETSDFMKRFYQLALERKEPFNALHEVQRDTLQALRRERGLEEAVRLAGPFMLSFQGQPK